MSDFAHRLQLRGQPRYQTAFPNLARGELIGQPCAPVKFCLVMTATADRPKEIYSDPNSLLLSFPAEHCVSNARGRDPGVEVAPMARAGSPSLAAARLAGDDSQSDGWLGARFFHL
jgi:hypothetical protein